MPFTVKPAEEKFPTINQRETDIYVYINLNRGCSIMQDRWGESGQDENADAKPSGWMILHTRALKYVFCG